MVKVMVPPKTLSALDVLMVNTSWKFGQNRSIGLAFSWYTFLFVVSEPFFYLYFLDYDFILLNLEISMYFPCVFFFCFPCLELHFFFWWVKKPEKVTSSLRKALKSNKILVQCSDSNSHHICFNIANKPYCKTRNRRAIWPISQQVPGLGSSWWHPVQRCRGWALPPLSDWQVGLQLWPAHFWSSGQWRTGHRPGWGQWETAGAAPSPYAHRQLESLSAGRQGHGQQYSTLSITKISNINAKVVLVLHNNSSYAIS